MRGEAHSRWPVRKQPTVTGQQVAYCTAADALSTHRHDEDVVERLLALRYENVLHFNDVRVLEQAQEAQLADDADGVGLVREDAVDVLDGDLAVRPAVAAGDDRPIGALADAVRDLVEVFARALRLEELRHAVAHLRHPAQPTLTPTAAPDPRSHAPSSLLGTPLHPHPAPSPCHPHPPQAVASSRQLGVTSQVEAAAAAAAAAAGGGGGGRVWDSV